MAGDSNTEVVKSVSHFPLRLSVCYGVNVVIISPQKTFSIKMSAKIYVVLYR